MTTTIDTNSTVNQTIKGKFVNREVYHCVTSMAEYSIKKSLEGDSNAPLQYEELENMYSYPEYYGTFAKFEGGTEEQRQGEIDRLKEVIEEKEQTISGLEENKETTGEQLTDDLIEALNDDIEKLNEEISEIEDLENESQEVFEWWIVSSWLAEKLKEKGCVVGTDGLRHYWGRTTTGQAILLDGVISQICSDMGILEGQANSWAVNA